MILLKNDEQIDGIRASCKAVARLFTLLHDIVKAGISTKEIDDYCVEYISKIGGTPAWYSEGFPGAVCTSINDELIHGVPSKRRLQNGDMVTLDIGINLNGYISDSAVTYPVGNVSKDNKHLLDVTTECLYRGIAACRAGNRLTDIARAVYSHARQHGYGVVADYCGHGVGLHVHEEPSVTNVPHQIRTNTRLRPGMVLAIEPMLHAGSPDVEIADDGWTVVSADHSMACHMEHTVAIFKDHTEILSQLTDDEKTRM